MWSVILGLAGEFWPYIVGAGALFGAYLMGGSKQKLKQTKRKAKADEKAHDRINKRNPVDPADRPDVIRRLREHAKR